MNGLRKSVLPALAVALSLAAATALAQTPRQTPARTPPMSSLKSGTADRDPFMPAMEKMNKAMAAAPSTGNVDHDFVAMMIPHHQGAVDMATIELARGKDPMLRRMAQKIIGSQEHEIEKMRAWEAKNPPAR